MNNKETMQEAGYTYGGYSREEGGHILIDANGKREVWFANKNHASYGIIFRNTHLEFARSLNEPEPKQLLRSFTKEFKVVAVSSNMNSFGLRGVVLVAKDGEAWQGGVNYLYVPKQGDIIRLIFRETSTGALSKYPQFPSGWEIPERLPDAPAEVVKEAFG